VRWNASTDSHQDLKEWLGLDDTKMPELRNWVGVEFSPPKSELLGDLEQYVLSLDDPISDWVGYIS
jgi:hypothetical protein